MDWYNLTQVTLPLLRSLMPALYPRPRTYPISPTWQSKKEAPPFGRGNGLARAGHHVIYCNSRFRGTDSALLMEKVVEDLGECIKDAKSRLGYAKVVLAGWSGGGSLSVFYQQQAQHATITSSPSGDGPDLRSLRALINDRLG